MATAAGEEAPATDLSSNNLTRLPFELRATIWRLAEPDFQLHRLVRKKPRFCIVSPPPPITLAICQESRMLALQRFQPLLRAAHKSNAKHENEDECRPYELKAGLETVFCDPNTDIIVMSDVSYWCSVEYYLARCSSNPWAVFRSVFMHWEYLSDVGKLVTCFSGLQTITYTCPVLPDKKLGHWIGSQPNCRPRQDFFDEDKAAAGADGLEESIKNKIDDSPMDMDTGDLAGEDTKCVGRRAPFLQQTEVNVRFALLREVCQCKEDSPCLERLWPNDGGKLMNKSMSWRERDMAYSGSVPGLKQEE